MDSILKQEYTDPARPGAFSGREAFFRELKKRKINIKKPQLTNWLEKQESYTLHRPIRKKFKRNPIIVSGIDDTFQIDLNDLPTIADSNDSYRYILTCIDVFSKYAWAIALKSKSADSVLDAIKSIFSSGRYPKRVQTDEGKEFLNSKLKLYFKLNNIKLYILNSEMKASIVERFNRTLKEKMWRYFSENQTFKYIDVLDSFVQSYNNSFHRSIKTSPFNVNTTNEDEIWFNLYGFKRNAGNPIPIKFRFDVGDKVRISRAKGVFEKGYTANWTREIFVIDKQIPRIPPVYILRDTHPKPEVIDGVFYEQQLQKIAKEDDVFYVEDIIKKRKTKGTEEVFVRWLGYSDKFNSWIPASNFIDTFENLKQVSNNSKNRIQFSI